MEDKNLEPLIILTENSREFLNRQINDKYNLESKAGALIGFSSIFFSLIILIPEKIMLIIVVPILLFIIGLIFLLSVMKANVIRTGYKEEKYDELIKKEKKDILLYELGANRTAIKINRERLKRLKRNYNYSIHLIISSIIIASGIIFYSNVKLKTSISMDLENNKPKTTKEKNDLKTVEQSFFIPDVPEEEINILEQEKIFKKQEKGKKKNSQ